MIACITELPPVSRRLFVCPCAPLPLAWPVDRSAGPSWSCSRRPARPHGLLSRRVGGQQCITEGKGGGGGSRVDNGGEVRVVNRGKGEGGQKWITEEKGGRSRELNRVSNQECLTEGKIKSGQQ